MSSVQKKLSDEVNNWDNVKTVSAVAISSNNATVNYGTLFLNGNHRMPITVLLSFTLADPNSPGPTKQEIQDALSWINYADESAVTQLSFYAEGDDNFDDTYNLYYYQSTDSVSKNVKNVDTSYQYTINYQIQPSETIVTGNQFKLAIELNAQRSGTQSPFVFKSDSGSSSVQAYYDLNFVPNKTYLKPTDGGTSTISNHYLKWQVETTIPTSITTYPLDDTLSLNNHHADVYFLTIDPVTVSGFSFHFNDFNKIDNFKELSTSDTTGDWYLPSYSVNIKDKTEYNIFKACIFRTYQQKYKGNVQDAVLTETKIGDGDVIAQIFVIDKTGYYVHPATMYSASTIKLPEYCFVLIWESTEYRHSGDTRTPFGNSIYTVPLLDNYGNLVQASVSMGSDAKPSISSVI
ncbi:hypothetical protein J6187_003691 [Salmonella enterica]|nr:hypothetical protein [Salmonella enterica]EHG9741733.1 hypothetical protein [Salmonella enterica]